MAPAILERPLDPIYLGATWSQPFLIQTEDVDGVRAPLDMTGRTATLHLARVGIAQTYEPEGVAMGAGLVIFGAADEETADWGAGRYTVELTLTDGADVLSLAVGEVMVVRGAAVGGSAGFMPGAEQPPGVHGVVIAATGAVQVVLVDRVVIEGTGTGPGGPISIADVTGLPEALADRATDAELTAEAGARGAADTALSGRLDTAETKLAGISPGATANQTNAFLLARANHTGTQAISTVSGLQPALDAKAPAASPALTGVPTAPTPAPGDGSTQIANMAAVSAAIQAIVGMSPADLDTLAEIAARIQSGESNYAALVTTIAGKLSKAANLSDLADAPTARNSLGLGTAATAAASAFQPADADLTAIAALTTTTFGRALLTLADAAAGRTALALGSAAVASTGDFLATGARGAVSGVAPLGADSLIPASYLPAIAVTDVFTVGSQAAMLALTAEKGDIAIRSDLNKSFALATNSPATLADWKELLTPTDAVLAVAGLTGSISAASLKNALAIALADVTDASANGRSLVSAANYAAMKSLLALGNVDNTADSAKPVSTAQAAAILAAKPVEFITVALSDETTDITTGTAKVTMRMPYAFVLSDVRASLSTASSSGLPTVNIKEAGVPILSTKITIDATEKTSVTAATLPVISDPNLADDAEITFDIDVAGTGARGLKVMLIGRRA